MSLNCTSKYKAKPQRSEGLPVICSGMFWEEKSLIGGFWVRENGMHLFKKKSVHSKLSRWELNQVWLSVTSATTAQPFEDHGTSREASWYDIHHGYDSYHESPFMSMITLIPTVWITTITYNYLQFFLFLISTTTIGTGTGIGMIGMISSSGSSRRSWGNLTTTVAGGLDCGRIFRATAIDGFPPSPQPPSRPVHLHKAPVLLASTHISWNLWKVSKVSSDLMPRSVQSYKSYMSSLRFQPAWTWNQWIKPRLRTSQSPHDAQSSHGLWGFTRSGRILFPTKTDLFFYLPGN